MILHLREGDFDLARLHDDGEEIHFHLKIKWKLSESQQGIEPDGVEQAVPWGIGSFLLLTQDQKAVFVPAAAARLVSRYIGGLTKEARLNNVFVFKRHGQGMRTDHSIWSYQPRQVRVAASSSPSAPAPRT